jgi:hypothetical protein
METPGRPTGRPGAWPQYFGAAGAPDALQEDFPGPPLALQDDLPLPAGAAAPPLALHELLPPAAEGSVAPGAAPFPPPHPTAEPMSIPATAETARVFARFMVLVSSLLLEERLHSRFFPATPRQVGDLVRAKPSQVSFCPAHFFCVTVSQRLPALVWGGRARLAAASRSYERRRPPWGQGRTAGATKASS